MRKERQDPTQIRGDLRQRASPSEGLLAASMGGAQRVGRVLGPAVQLLWGRASVVAASKPTRTFQFPGSATFV